MRFKPKYVLEISDEENFISNITKIEDELSKCINTGTFNAFDNTNIYYEYYLTENSIANIVIVHGLSEFTKKFNELVYCFLNNGYNVFIFDQRCHGLSGRLTKHKDLLHVDNFDDYVKDLEYFIDNVVMKTADLPINLYSHSMGGAICALYLAKHSNKIEKSVFSAPMFEPTVDVVPMNVALKGVKVGKFFLGGKRKFPLSQEFNPETPYKEKYGSSKERYEYSFRMRCKNPMYQSTPMSFGWVYGSLTVRNKIFSENIINNITCPILILSAEKDATVNNNLHYEFMNKNENCKVIEIKRATHALLASDKETVTEVISKTLDFYKQ